VWFNFKMQLSLPYVIRMLITTHNTCSQAHFHYTLWTRVQVSVHHIGQHMIKHILFLSFIQLQYVLPLNCTSKSLAVQWSHIHDLVHCMPCPVPLPTAESRVKNQTRKYRNQTVIHVVTVHLTFSMQGDLHWWNTLLKVCEVCYNILVNCS
jgi:hypothetical protein